MGSPSKGEVEIMMMEWRQEVEESIEAKLGKMIEATYVQEKKRVDEAIEAVKTIYANATTEFQAQTDRINSLIVEYNGQFERHKQVIENMWTKCETTSTQINANLAATEQKIMEIGMEARASKEETDKYRKGIDDFADTQRN